MKYLIWLLIISMLIVGAIAMVMRLRLFVVASGSMAPELERGDLVATKALPEYYLGDTITYLQSGQRITHKVTAKRYQDQQLLYQTKGVANQHHDDQLVKPSAVVGKVVASFPKIGIVLLLPKQAYFLLATWALALVVIVFELKILVVTLKKQLA